MYKEIDITKLVLQEQIDRAEQARLAASVRRELRSRHRISEQLRRFGERLDS